MVLYYLSFFIASCAALYFAGNWVVASLSRISKFLGWTEFAVAFFVMALAGSIPNLFLGITSIANGIPELSLSDVIGGNVVDMTLAIALATLFSKKGISSNSHTVQTSLLFTFIAAILPLLLFTDGQLTRFDGLILIALFGVYIYWLLSKKERFTKVYNHYTVPVSQRLKIFILDLSKFTAGITILLIIANGIVIAANSFSNEFDVPIALVGVLLVGLGNCFPETYFSIISARKGETRMILGDIMGAIIIPSTFILGIVTLISPITITDISIFSTARYFLIIASIFFFLFVRSNQELTKREAVILLAIYIAFIFTEIFLK